MSLDGNLLWCILFNFNLGDWTFIVNGRKRSYVLHAKLQEEATRWANAIQEVNKMGSTINSEIIEGALGSLLPIYCSSVQNHSLISELRKKLRSVTERVMKRNIVLGHFH